MHSISVSRSIQDEARSLVEKIKAIETASTVSDCLAAIDEVCTFVSKEDYWSALKSFQFFRKVSVKVIPGALDGNGPDEQLTAVGKVELMLYKATHTSATAPFSKRQKTDLLKDVLRLKQQVEEFNPARVLCNAAS